MNNHIRNSAFILSVLFCGTQKCADRTNCMPTPVHRMPVVTTSTTTETTKNTQMTEEDRKKAAILSHVAQIANSLAAIAVNSKDRSNVGVQVGNVLGNALGIVMVASQRNGKPMDLQMVEAYLKSMDEQTKMKIAAMIATEMNKTMRTVRV